MIALVPLTLLIASSQEPTITPQTEEQPQQWIRRAEGENIVSLELVSRRYAAKDLPDVWLVGVAHIADLSFYDEVTKLLDEMDIVLYESVRPSGSRPPNGMTDEERVLTTQKSLEFVADISAQIALDSNRMPTSLAEVIVGASLIDRRLPSWVADASIDAWARPFVLQLDEGSGTITIWSFGSDGTVGGEGYAADLNSTREVQFSIGDDPDTLEHKRKVNIQEDLAEVLGLEFQLNALPYEEPNWFCSDLTIDEVEAKLIERGADTSILGTLTGDSFSAAIASSLMKLIPMVDALTGGGIQESARLLMIELLSMPDSDTMLEGIDPELARVIIVDRNTELLGDLEATMELFEDVSTIAVLYGTGHMKDLDSRLGLLFGYAPVEERWFTSMSVDPDESLLDESDLRRMRFMLAYQMHQMKKQSEAEETEEE